MLPLILGGEEQTCLMEKKPTVCIKGSLTAGSTGESPRQGVRVEKELPGGIKALFTKSVSFPSEHNSQVPMEIHHLDTHVLKIEWFAG